MDDFFSYLDSNNINKHCVPNIRNWSIDKILEFGQNCYCLLPSPEYDNTGYFDYVVNNSLNGGPTPCFHLECRLKNVDNLSRYALLYANRIILPNPFEGFASKSELSMEIIKDIKAELITNLKIIFYIKPLIDLGIAKFVDRNLHMCKDCYENIVGHAGFTNKFETMENVLVEEYIDNVTFTYEQKGSYRGIVMDGPVEFLSHGTKAFQLTEKGYNQLNNKVGLYNARVFKKEEVKSLKITNMIINPILNDILMQNYYASEYGSQYLTDRDLDLKILNYINNVDSKNHNNLLIDTLGHTVPFIYDIEISRIAKLREEEGEAFLVYRDAIKEAINTSKTVEDYHQMCEVFDDIVRPELNNIELTIKNSKKLLVNSLSRDLIIGAGSIAIGTSNGLLPDNFAAIVSAVGGIGAVVDILKQGKKLFSENDDIKNNKYYFLWKIKQQAYKV